MENQLHFSPEPDQSRMEGDRRFAVFLKRMRLGLQNKQVWLSEAIGCSDAAVSLWESGARIPTPQSLSRLLAALAKEGISTSELLELRRIWLNEYTLRRGARRSVP
jgi:hypothetical protein